MLSRITRSRRLAVTLVASLLLTLAACGDDSTDAADASGLDSVTISGDVGTAPKVTFDGQVTVTTTETKTLVTGDGPKLEQGDQVLTHLWIGNGFTQQQALNTYDDKKPELITLDDQLGKVFQEAIVGQTVGSRVAVAATAKEAFGASGNPTLGIANKDTVIMVIDLVSGVLDGPQGTAKPAPGWTPKIVEKDDVPQSLDFTGTPEPSSSLRVAPLVQGDGAKVEKGQTIVVNYLGQVYGGAAPFDSSYARGEPTSFQIGVGSVVKGWDEALVGRAVGSRVMLSVPPDLGYGDQGNKDAGIKGTDTLYFLVDILAAG